jgi:hypothetical protein
MSWEEVAAHAKRLYIHIHPDKVQNEAYCTELFQMVKSAATGYIPTDAFNSSSLLTESSGVVHMLISCLKKNKWCQVKVLLKNAETGNETLDVLATIVFFRLGDFHTAVERIPSRLVKTKASLEFLKEQLSSDISVLTVEEKIDKLLQLQEILRKLPELYASEKAPYWPSEELFTRLIPYQLFVSLKDCFHAKKDLLSYERYLRDAIRFCPDGCPSDIFHLEKQKLVAELKLHLKSYYTCDDFPFGPFFQTELKRLAIQAFEEIVNTLQKLDLTNKDKEIVKQLTSLSIDDPTSLILIIDEWEGKNTNSKPKYGQLFGSISTYINQVSTNIFESLGYHSDYPPQTKKTLEHCIKRLKCWNYYQRDEKELAAHYFLEMQDYLSLGCILSTMGRFAEAIEYWNKLPSKKSDNYIFRVMNFCDQLCVPEESFYERQCLGPVDTKQLQVLKSHQNQ